MKQTMNNEEGLTLVEVLASIVILMIIVTSVLLIFIQTTKSNRTSEDIVDATYVAQTEMEYMYEISKDGKMPISEYDDLPDEGDWKVYEKINPEVGYRVEVRLKEDSNLSEMKRIVVNVYEEKNPIDVEAQMENLFEWEATP